MLIGPAMFDRLTADPTVSGIIGTRLYPAYNRESNKVYPLAVYKIENETDQMASTGPTGLVSVDVIIACIAPTYRQASKLSDAVKTALNGTSWTDSTNDLNVQGCFMADDGRRDDVITEPSTETILYYVSELTFNLFCNAV